MPRIKDYQKPEQVHPGSRWESEKCSANIRRTRPCWKADHEAAAFLAAAPASRPFRSCLARVAWGDFVALRRLPKNSTKQITVKVPWIYN
jgi:hypothetical protein